MESWRGFMWGIGGFVLVVLLLAGMIVIALFDPTKGEGADPYP